MFKKIVSVLIVVLTSALFFGRAEAQSPFKNIRDYVKLYHLDSYFGQTSDKPVKIAIFDTGFAGLDEAKRQNYLPSDNNNSLFHQPTMPMDPNDAAEDHGKYMAEIVYAMMTDEGRQPQFTPEINLYYVGGFKNFQDAITDCINSGVEMILYASVREWGGNNDGKGIFNTEVNRALAANIIWVNAAGDYKTRTFNSSIISHNGAVQLPDDGSLHIVCGGPDLDPEVEECVGTIYLSWNDYKDVKDIGTNKDLDIRLYKDDLTTLVAESATNQVEKMETGKSIYPKEIIKDLKIPRGDYYIQISDKSGNFTPADRLTIAVDGTGFLVNRYDLTNNLFTPADNPGAITVGASDFARSSVSSLLHKPEQTTRSTLVLKDGRIYKGSSNSAAIVFAGDGILKSLRHDLTRKQLLAFTSDPGTYVTFPVGEMAKDYLLTNGEAFKPFMNAQFGMPYTFTPGKPKTTE